MSKIIVKKPSDDELKEQNVTSWGTWGCEVSRFDWSYDTTEHCYILEGNVTIETDDGDVEIKAGDFVTFPKGLSCVWNVKKPIRKHYRFE